MNNHSSNPLFDFIGNIYGHANELKLLPDKLGYTIQNGSYAHLTRKAFFAGDYIDRGPQVRETKQWFITITRKQDISISLILGAALQKVWYPTSFHTGAGV